MDMAEYQQQMQELRPGSKLRIGGTVYAVTDGRVAVLGNPSDELCWTSLPLRRVNPLMGQRAWLHVPGRASEARPAYLVNHLGVYNGPTSNKPGSPLTWRGRAHFATGGQTVTFVHATTLKPGEFIRYRSTGLTRLHLEKLDYQSGWQVYELTSIERNAVGFMR